MTNVRVIGFRFLQGWGCLIGLLLASGCTSFHQNWNSIVSHPAPAQDLQGAWDGNWRSDVNGHHGRLRCLMQKESPGVYQAWFHANFWKILSYSYKVPLHVQETNGLAVLHGESDLGRLVGGVYTYDGQASPTNFSAIYISQSDHGVFEMRRPPPPSN